MYESDECCTIAIMFISQNFALHMHLLYSHAAKLYVELPNTPFIHTYIPIS